MLARYTLYHSTDAAAAASIMLIGFVGQKVYFANMPWKIQPHGSEVIEVIVELDLEPEAIPPAVDKPHFMLFSGTYVNDHTVARRLLSTAERDAIIAVTAPPGSFPMGGTGGTW